MALDLVSFDAALKEYYTDLMIQDLTYKNNPFLAMVPKSERFVGRNMPIPIKHGNPQGRSATFQTAKANQTATQLKQFLITRVKDYSLATIDSETMDASANDAGAFIEAATIEIDSAIESLVQSMSMNVYKSGYAVRGRVGSSAATQVTLSVEDDIVFFEVGMVLVASILEGGPLRAGSMTVQKVDRDNGVITVDALIAGLADGDFLYVQGDVVQAGGVKLQVSGLDAWVPRVAPTTGDSFFGLDRSVDPTRLAGQRIDGTGLTIKEALLKVAVRCAREGGAPDVALVNLTQYERLENELGAKVQYMKRDAKDLQASIAFTGINIHGPRGEIAVVPDHNCPIDTAYVLQMDTWKFHTLGGAPKLLTHDGNQMLRVSDQDAVEVRIGYYGQLACNAPGRNGRVTLTV